MAVDRGGLQYTIEVINQFSGPLRQFQSEISANRQSFNTFKRDVRGLSTDARAASAGIRQLASTSRQLNASNRAAATSTRANAQALRDQANAQLFGRRAQQDAILGQRSSAAAVRANTQALTAQVTTLNGVVIAQSRLGRSGRAAAAGIDRAAASARRAQGAFGGLLLTVRRLVTTLVFFEAARFALDGIRRLVGGTVEFASSLEQAELGVATLLTALGELRNENDQVFRGTQALTVAQNVSREQLRQLRVEALSTAATFDQLAQTFQVALAPGAVGGLDLDEIRKVTVQISQAASAIGLAQNELNEEVRSLLAGTISTRFTRIATALDISNADISRAREAGTLFEFLQERFEAFTIASGRILLTFQARLTNAIDALFLLSSTGAGEFFQTLTDLLESAADAARTFNEETGEIELNEDAVLVFRILFNALSDALEKALELGSALDFQDLQSAALAMASVIRVVTDVFSGVIQGLLEGGGDLVFIFRTILATIRNIRGIELFSEGTVGTAREFLVLAVRMFVAFKGIQLAVFALTTPLGLAAVLAVVIAASFNKAAKDSKTLAEAVTGIEDVSLEGFLEIAGAEATAFFKNFALQVKQTAETIGRLFVAVFEGLGTTLRDTITSALTLAFADFARSAEGAAVSKFLGISPEALNSLRQAAAATRDRLSVENSIQASLDRQFAQTKVGIAQDAERAAAKARQELNTFEVARRGDAARAARLVVARREDEDRFRAQLEAQRQLRRDAEEVALIPEAAGTPLQDRRDSAVEGALRLEERLEESLRRQIILRKEAEDIITGGAAEEDRLRARFLELAEIRKRTALETAQAEIEANNLVVENLKAARSEFEAEGGIGFTGGDGTTLTDNFVTAVEGGTKAITELLKEAGLALPEGIIEGLEQAKEDLNDLLTGDFKLKEEGEKAGKTFGKRFKEGLAAKLKRFDAFNQFLSFLLDATTKFADLVSDLIIDAFDPNTEVSSRERILTFLRELAREAIRILVRVAVAKALAFAFSVGENETPGANQGGGIDAVGRLLGGLIGGSAQKEERRFDAKARNVLFNFPVGFAGGGKIGGNGMPGRSLNASSATVRRMRPPSLDARDTIPIWTQPQEWVIRRNSALKYGSTVMDAINRGLIDPFALKALAGTRPSVIRRNARSSVERVGFQTGGAVGSAVATPSPAVGVGSQRVVGAVLVPDEQTMDRLLAGGSGSMLEWLSDNSTTINGILSV